MATFTGGFSGSGSYRLRLEIWEDAGSVDINANTSVVYYQLWVDKLAGSGYWTGSASAGSSCDGGMAGASGLGGNWTPYDFRGYSSLLIASGSKTITHNSDGTGYISGGFYASDSSNFGSAGAAYGLTLTTIPRASTTTFASSDITVGTAATGTITRASGSFTHELSYSIGSLTGQTAGLSAYTGVATSFTFTPPLSVLKQMVGEAAKALVLTTITKNGATVIGTKNTVLNALPPNNIPYAAPNPSAIVIRCGPSGAVDPDGEYIKITPAFSVGSIYTSSEQNTLTYKIEAKLKSAGSYPATPLVNATVGSHGLTFTTPLVYGDYDPVTSGTQKFDADESYDIRITITDALGSVVVSQMLVYPTDAIVDFYKPTKGMSVGRKYDSALGGSLQLLGQGYQRDGKPIIDEDMLDDAMAIYDAIVNPWKVVIPGISSSGSVATINATTGLITLPAGLTSVYLRDFMLAGYEYLFCADNLFYPAGVSGLAARFTTTGTSTDIGATYYWSRVGMGGGAPENIALAGADHAQVAVVSNSSQCWMRLEVKNARDANRTFYRGDFGSPAGPYLGRINGDMNTNTVYQGMFFSPASGNTISGTMRVYARKSLL